MMVNNYLECISLQRIMNEQEIIMKAIGIMSGTSLDGIDICLVNIHQIKKDYTYEIEQFKSYKYRLS